MISINDIVIEANKFPDGTFAMRYLVCGCQCYNIKWKYDSEAECMALWNIVYHIRDIEPQASISLILPYLPNARMDRVKNQDEIFTLKWFAAFINHLAFENIFLHDVHSSEALHFINHVNNTGISEQISKVLGLVKEENVMFCYPDKGALEKYSKQFPRQEHIHGIKQRDWRSGKINALTLDNVDAVNHRNVLIVDDICSRGGTFIHTAKALKAAGAGRIYLYITHCENTIYDGDILCTDLIKHVYTTDSIYRGEHPKITVL